jgi:hypothetical protein
LISERPGTDLRSNRPLKEVNTMPPKTAKKKTAGKKLRAASAPKASIDQKLRSWSAGTWDAGGFVTIPASDISGTWSGTGSWEGSLQITGSFFTLGPVSWSGEGTFQLTGMPVDSWSGYGDAWWGSGSAGNELNGSGQFEGTVNGHYAYGTWTGTISVDRSAKKNGRSASIPRREQAVASD